MTDMPLEQIREELRRLASDGGFGQMAVAIDAHLAKAVDYERAVTEQAMLTECVSVTGRDPSDVIRDVIQWHVSNAAQPVEAVDVTDQMVHDALYARAGEWSVIQLFQDAEEAPDIMRIALRAGLRAALAHPRPTGEGAHMLADALADITATRLDGEAGSETYDCDGHAKCVDIADAALTRYETFIDSTTTGEQAGEVAWTKKAAEFIEKKAQSYADEFGRDDMGSISFGAGRGADKMEEYWMSLIDLAEDFRKLGGKCQVPPDGWECSRAVGHDGPCAASPAAAPDGEVG